MTKPELSIVILSYNTKELLMNCLLSLAKVRHEAEFEVVVVDNASTDGSAEMVKKEFSEVSLIINEKNLGFAAGNNKAKELCKGEFILFLNSDTVVKPGTINQTLNYLKDHAEAGAITCKLVLPNGQLDKDARRAFITPWIGLTHLVFHLDKVFPKSRLFAKYWYGYISADAIHEVDVIQGAYFLTRKSILDEINWYDTDYFLDGEDIDICWRIKQKGWKIIYYPKVSIIHYKGASKSKPSQVNNKISLREKLYFRLSGTNSMEIFYKKRMWKQYPLILNLIVILGINFIKLYRVIRTLILG
jgi:GT2 family glycosyltransferase